MTDSNDSATVEAFIKALTDSEQRQSRGKDTMSKGRWLMLKMMPKETPRLVYNPNRWKGGIEGKAVPYRKKEWAQFE